MAYSDRELLARLIKCEAGGEGDIGMKAVATVVMNRVRVPYGEYRRVGKGDLRTIIFQRNQFDCAMTTIRGQPNLRNIYAANPEPIHYQIADWALAGNRLSGTEIALWYFNPFRPSCPPTFPTPAGGFNTRIRQHCYYNPTPLYRGT